MGYIAYFLQMIVWSLECLFLSPPILLLAALGGLVMAIIAASRCPEALRGKWKWLSLPFLMPTIIILFGMIFQYRGDIGTAPAWPGLVIAILLWSHVPIGLVLVAIARKNFLVPIGLTAFQMWLSLGAAFMSSMSVTNVWL